MVCLNQGTLGTKTCPSGASLKSPTARQKSNPWNQCECWGPPLLALQGMQGQSRWHKGSPLPLPLERIPPCVTAQENASRPRSSASCSPCPAPAQPSPGQPIFIAGTAPFHPACRKHTEMHTVQMDAQTPARAQGHMPTTAHVSCLLHSHSPQTPQAWSLWLSTLGYGRQQEHCQQLVGPWGCWQPTWRTLESHTRRNAPHVVGSAGSFSSCRTIRGSQPLFQGAKALTCRPA